MGALIGYFTNWLAIKMLFRPYTEKRLFNIKLPFTPGLIPKRRELLAAKTARTISVHLLTDETLVKSMCGPEVKRNVEAIFDNILKEAAQSEQTLGEILSRADSLTLSGVRAGIAGKSGELSQWLADMTETDFFDENIKPVVISIIEPNLKGVLSYFIGAESVYANIRKNLAQYLRNPDNYSAIEQMLTSLYDKASDSVMIKDFAGTDEAFLTRLKSIIMPKYDSAVKEYLPAIFSALDLAGVIENKINEFEMKEAEEIIVSVVDRELRAITYLGGFLGFVIGLAPPVLQSFGIAVPK